MITCLDSKKALLSVMWGLLTVLWAPAILAQETNGPTVMTDREDYPPFSVVYIDGYGFQPGETVSNLIVQVLGAAPGTAYEPWEIAVEPDGHFFTSWYVFSEELLNTTLELTSTGETSGRVAKTQFTDANPQT